MTVEELKNALIEKPELAFVYTAKAGIELSQEMPCDTFTNLCEKSAINVETEFDLPNMDVEEAKKQGIKKFKAKFDDVFMEYWDNL